MANYFSNLSSTSTQSRFLSNKDRDSSQSSSTTVVASSATTASSLLSGATPPPARVPSKHFSTTLSDEQKGTSVREKSPAASTAGLPTTLSVHPLRSTYVRPPLFECPIENPARYDRPRDDDRPCPHRWVFWFRQQRAPGNKITNYEEGIKKISAFASVESFWSLWTHLHPPSALLPTTDYLLFHQGVRRPVWEDPLNLPGGKWILRLRKGVADRIWEELVLALIGDQFAGVAPPHEDEWPEICGCTISVRQSEDILSVWNRIDEPKLRERIRCVC
jgi:translation initiation factor 4E